MPNYQTHDRIALYTTPIIVGVAFFFLYPLHAILLGIFFLLANRYLSPDLDIDSIQNRRWGLFSFVWYPYRAIIHHRSILSHSGLLSATLRILYISIWILPVLAYFFSLTYIIDHILLYSYWYILLYIAIVLADVVHTLADLLWR